MMDHHSESEHSALESGQSVQQPEAAPVDTAKIQEALEKQVDQETADLPRLTVPDIAAEETDMPEEPALSEQPDKVRARKHRTGRSARERWWNPSVRSWFFTFMCMNMPVIGWFYLFYKAGHEKDPARKEFARAYLFYKLVFLIAGAIVLLILIWIGLGLLDQLLAYMEML